MQLVMACLQRSRRSGRGRRSGRPRTERRRGRSGGRGPWGAVARGRRRGRGAIMVGKAETNTMKPRGEARAEGRVVEMVVEMAVGRVVVRSKGRAEVRRAEGRPLRRQRFGGRPRTRPCATCTRSAPPPPRISGPAQRPSLAPTCLPPHPPTPLPTPLIPSRLRMPPMPPLMTAAMGPSPVGRSRRRSSQVGAARGRLVS